MQDDRAFLGSGWSFPPTFSTGGAEIAMSSGEEDVTQSLEILLSTHLGERVMRDDFGCNLSAFLFEEIDQSLVNRVRSVTSDAILFHESRIELNRLDVSQSGSLEGLLEISIDYTIQSTNSRYNMVFPFYLKEASLPGFSPE